MYIVLATYYNLPGIGSPKIDTSLLWGLSAFFGVLGLLYFGGVFFFRNLLSKRFYKKNAKREELAPIISNFLFHSSNDPKEEQKEYVGLKIEIREYLKDKRFRKILAEILFDLQRDVAGNTKIRLFTLFRELGLHHDCYKKLNSWRWETVAQGIDELAQMQVGESFQLIQKYINDRRPTVRKQAELAIVSLNREGINYLLDTTSYGISEWQQLKLMEALSAIQNYQPPKFKGWLLSQNRDVVLFALRLILHYDQNDAKNAIIELLKHKNDEIKKEAISCIRSFHFVEASPTMKQVFFSCTEFVKIQLLNAIADFAQKEDIIFLKTVLAKETKFSVVSKAQAAFDAILPDSILPTKDIVEVMPFEEGGPIDDEIKDNSPQKKEVVGTDHQDSLEIEEVEIYDIVGPDAADRDKENHMSPKKNGAEENSRESDIEFDFSEMDAPLTAALDASLGLVDGDGEMTGSSDSVFLANYMSADHKERHRILTALEENFSHREKALVEAIVENEKDAELRFRAFNCLKMVKVHHGAQQLDSTESVPLADNDGVADKPQETLLGGSVFSHLYDKTEDRQVKKMLLQQAAAIGDGNELTFLTKIAETEDAYFGQLANKAIAAIHDRQDTREIVSNTKPTGDGLKDNETKAVPQELEIDFQELQELATNTIGTSQEKLTKDKLPMELMFLHEEFGIGEVDERTKKPRVLDFELSEEFFANKTIQ
ncbi:hypothetical protein [Croceitalea dokdonensis]|uniref:hypothetical protein n=1 Tax=Croceitalea dokdonensis TaxID=346188 RepID=UPI0006CA1F22|nr:hypothetical protein [Croceitalea dokdonensis]